MWEVGGDVEWGVGMGILTKINLFEPIGKIMIESWVENHLLGSVPKIV